MTTRQQLDIQRTSHLSHADQGRWYGLSAENWAKRILADDSNDIDSLHDDWATRVPVMTIEQGAVAGQISDLQGRFNLNNLVSSDALSIERFERLLTLLDIDPEITPAVLDWIDEDLVARPAGAEDSYYTNQRPSYRTANRPMADISELRLVRGITAEIYARLLPYVTVLPVATPININTASPTLLATLSDNNQLDIDAIINFRQQQPFSSAQLLNDFNGDPEQPVKTTGLAVNSNYFQLTTQVSIGVSNQQSYSLLLRRKTTSHTIRRWTGF